LIKSGFLQAHAGFSIEHHASLSSSNDRAMVCAEAGMDRHWVVVDQQTVGRGRQGRVWSSPVGNLYASLALIDPCEIRFSPQIGFVAGLAAHQALSSLADFGSRLKLKWPNDLLLDGAKLSGQLLEGRNHNGHLFLVVGIGINLAHHPDDTPYPAIDLASSGVHLDVEMVLMALCDAFDRLLSVWDRGQGFARIRQLWLDHAAYLDKAIEIRTERGVLRGRFAGLDAEGRLLLQPDTQGQEQGLKTIEAGDFYPLDLVEQLRPQKG
jgi:BirA family biotin operon repressor/biotin-[acetyl-CoA-carboxylase] ligase